MRKIAYVALIIIALACTDNSNTSDNQLIVTHFLEDVRSLERVPSKNIITDFTAEAKNMAAVEMDLNKSNIQEFLTQGKKYSYGVIICENHTIVRITDFEDCQQSNSWSACMPHGQGFIKKGDLVSQKGFINNIIGTPDSQKRIGYLFE